MKGIIEVSLYLVIFAYISFISIDFIKINQDVNELSQTSQYVENYIEVKCSNLEKANAENELTHIKESLKERDIDIVFGETKTAGSHAYVDYTIRYNIKSAMLGISSEHIYKGLARYVSTEPKSLEN